MTKRECANLQSLSSLKFLPEANANCLNALGNSISAELVKRIGLSIRKFSQKTIIDNSDDYLQNLIKEAV